MRSNRHVPLIMGILTIALGFGFWLVVGGWLGFLIAVILVGFGWKMLKNDSIATSNVDSEIVESTTSSLDKKQHSSQNNPPPKKTMPVDMSDVPSVEHHSKYNPLLEWSFWKTATVMDVTKVLDGGADLNVRASTKHRATPLHVAARHSKTPAVVELLLNRGANLNACTNRKETPLHWAANSGKTPAVMVLLNYNANVNARGQYGRVPLHEASFIETPAVLALLDREADVDARDEYGKTPLHRAAEYSKTPAVVELLLDRGADATAKSNEGKTPCDCVEDNEHLRGTNIYQRFQQKKPQELHSLQTREKPKESPSSPNNPLLDISFWQTATVDKINRVLDDGADINARDRNGNTPLHLAVCYTKTPAVVELLLDREADAATAKNNEGKTPCDCAAGNEHLRGTNVYQRLAQASAEFDMEF